MKLNGIGDLGCSALPAMERCDAELPDSPECAPNYHFGMLLGVDDFRAEQGFHLGRLRRHQRLLHGAGVVAGYAVTFSAEAFELRVEAGYAVDALGRDLVLAVKQCVSLPRWWLVHREEDAFHDIATPDDATVDLDVMVCYATCLGSPVPAIAEPCAGDAADVASEGHILESDRWLLDRQNELKAMPVADQPTARAGLLREILARAVAETSPNPPAHEADEDDLCLPLARLRNVHLKLEPDGWTATVGAIEMGVRETLLPGSLLQGLILANPPPQPVVAGPVVVAGGATLSGTDLNLVFNQRLAPASATVDVFAVSEFVDALGWKPFTLAMPTYDESDPARPTVHLVLDRAPTGTLVRVTVVGSGNAPLLGANLIPAGAVNPDSDGRILTTSIFRG
jgi:hypothetical protein